MKRMNLRLLAVFLTSVLLFPQSAGYIKGCADYGMEDIYNTSMFIPQMIKNERFVPFFLSIENYYSAGNSYYTAYESNDTRNKSLSDYNIEEWSAFFQGFVNQSDIGKIVYELKIPSIDSISAEIEVKLKSAGSSSKTNDAGKLVKEGLLYLKLAKQIEEILQLNPWVWNPQPLEMDKAIAYKNQALTSYKSHNNSFIKMRYAFQYVRLCHATGDYSSGIDFVNKDYPFKAEQGMMYFRTLGYQAACYVKLREFSKANVIYARLYDLGEAFKFQAFESFHPQNESEWNATLAEAKNEREKELLWHLFGVYADPLKGMKEIAAINVNSDLLPLLMVRAVQIAELNSVKNRDTEYYGDLYNSENRSYESFTPDPLYSWNSIYKEQTGELIEILKFIAGKRKSDAGIWHMGTAYLYWVMNDAENCMKYSELGEKSAPDNKFIALQNGINQLLLGYNRTKVLNTETEQAIYQLISKILIHREDVEAHNNAIRYVLNGLREIYLQQGDFLKAELANPRPEEYYVHHERIADMIDKMNNKNNSAFEKYLLGRYPFTVNELYDVEATEKIYSYDFYAALAIYKAHPEAGSLELLGNPFNYRKVDCHDCDHAMPQKTRYTKMSFVEKMIELKNKAEDALLSKEERANNYFLYANGLYNMTYYGNARLVSSTVINRDALYQNYRNANSENETTIYSYHDCREAETYYLKAVTFTAKREFQARSLWMAAKCEHNTWLETEYDEESTGDFVAGKYFQLLRQTYADTKYYREVIDECGYFCQFNNPGAQFCIKNQ